MILRPPWQHTTALTPRERGLVPVPAQQCANPDGKATTGFRLMPQTGQGKITRFE